MIKVTDLVFSAGDCCGLHKTAHVDRGDGFEFGVSKNDDGTYNVKVYKGLGLLTTLTNLDDGQLEIALNATY